MKLNDRMIVAVDVTSMSEAKRVIDATAGKVGGYKFASTTLEACDQATLIAMAEQAGGFVFLDRKFHDIPMQNVGAAERIAVKHATVSMLSMHASAGQRALEKMAEAMKDARSEDNPLTTLAITLLTSITPDECRALYDAEPEEMVMRFARVAALARIPGVVCSGKEVKRISIELPRLITVVPGTRMPGGDTHDQARVVTPTEAMRDGADYQVHGRAVRDADDPGQAIDDIVASIEDGLIAGLEGDMLQGSQDALARMRSSDWSKALRRLGGGCLAAIADHLEETRPTEETWDSLTCWGCHLMMTANAMSVTPPREGDVDSLASWCRDHAA